jgi:ADP-ribose pyrophosphatase
MVVSFIKMKHTVIKDWQAIEEKEVYGGYRKVIRRRYLLPDGQKADFDLIKGGQLVCILAITSDNQIILAKQFRAGPGKILLELPGGGIERNEDPQQAAARELLEETGYSGTLQQIAHTPTDAYSTAHRYHFVATNCQLIAIINNDEHETTEVATMSLVNFRLHLQSGQLTDRATGYLGLDYLNLL